MQRPLLRASCSAESFRRIVAIFVDYFFLDYKLSFHSAAFTHTNTGNGRIIIATQLIFCCLFFRSQVIITFFFSSILRRFYRFFVLWAHFCVVSIRKPRCVWKHFLTFWTSSLMVTHRYSFNYSWKRHEKSVALHTKNATNKKEEKKAKKVFCGR